MKINAKIPGIEITLILQGVTLNAVPSNDHFDL